MWANSGNPDHGFLALAVALSGVYAYAILLWPVLTRRGRVGQVVSAGLAIVAMTFALLIPADKTMVRAAAVFLVTELMFKMIDYSRYWRRHGAGPLRDYLRFLIPFPPLLVCFRPAPARPVIIWQQEVRRALGGLAGFGIAFLALYLVRELAAVRSSFALDHAIKLVLFVIAVESLSRLSFGLERLTGYQTKPFIDQAHVSRTVGEFWMRYDTRVHEWLMQNVFRPAGGTRSPIWGIFLTFFVSAVFHEVGFGIATSRFDGYQFVFFMIQAPAVLLSARLNQATRRWGLAGNVLSHVVTICWFAVSSVLFFHGVNRVFPCFYASQPPL